MNITKFWCLPIPYFHVVTSWFQSWSRKVLIRTSRTNGNKRIKIFIYRNFEASVLTSKYRFYKFWDFDPSFDVIIAKNGSKKAKICTSCAKDGRRIKVIPEWNHTDISNTICGRKIKTRSTWTFLWRQFLKNLGASCECRNFKNTSQVQVLPW